MRTFLEVSLGSYVIGHGYDVQNKEIEEKFILDGFSKKLVALDRIKSLSEKYLLTDYLDGRWIYREYKETYEAVKNMLFNK